MSSTGKKKDILKKVDNFVVVKMQEGGTEGF